MTDLTDLFAQTQQQFPILRNLGMNFVQSPGQGEGNMLELWPPDETGDPSYPRPAGLPLGTFGVQNFSPDTKPLDIMGDVASHYLRDFDPRVKSTYEGLASSLTPDQRGMLGEQYQYAQQNEGETRPFDQWQDVTGLPAMFRGYAFDQWPGSAGAYTPEQRQSLDKMMEYLRAPRGDAGGLADLFTDRRGPQ